MERMGNFIAKIFESQASSLFEASPVDRELERKALRKLDYAILPVMAMFYFLSFLVSTICTLLLVKPDSCPKGSGKYWFVISQEGSLVRTSYLIRHRECSHCRFAKGPPHDGSTVSDLSHRSLCVRWGTSLASWLC